jgi:hypothetical protein
LGEVVRPLSAGHGLGEKET